MGEAVLCEGLTRRFGDLTAVDHLDLTIHEGEVFGFLGPNGAGKTTTVRLLNGVLDATEGRAWVLGHDVASGSEELRRHTGVLTENPSLYESLSARDNLRFYGDLYGVPVDLLPRRVDTLLGEFDLAERADDLVGRYSKGMRQRLALARTLLHEPQMLFLDEPTSGLDPVVSRMVNEVIQRLATAGGRTILLCTHNLAEAQRLCSRIGVIDRGVLKAVGTPRELARHIWQALEVEVDLRGAPSEPVGRALDAMPAVRGRRLEGSRLVVELDAEESIPDLVAAVSSAGGRIYGVAVREHSLEDVYFEIQGEATRADVPERGAP